MAKITAIYIKYKSTGSKDHSHLAIVDGSPSMPHTCIKALEKSSEYIKAYPVIELLEMQTTTKEI